MIGTGAGTYQFAWEKHRSIDVPVHNAHSLYLEAFAELGAIGGILVLALVAGILWWAFCAWRDARDEQRELHAVALAALVAMAVAPASTGSGRSPRWGRSSSIRRGSRSPAAAPSWRRPAPRATRKRGAAGP